MKPFQKIRSIAVVAAALSLAGCNVTAAESPIEVRVAGSTLQITSVADEVVIIEAIINRGNCKTPKELARPVSQEERDRWFEKSWLAQLRGTIAGYFHRYPRYDPAMFDPETGTESEFREKYEALIRARIADEPGYHEYARDWSVVRSSALQEFKRSYHIDSPMADIFGPKTEPLVLRYGDTKEFWVVGCNIREIEVETTVGTFGYSIGTR